MRTRIKTRAGIGVIVSCVAVLAGAPSASALSGAGFIANQGTDRPFIAHGAGSVYNTDPNNEHWVNASLGVFAPAGSTHVTVSGYALGERRKCTINAMARDSPGWTFTTLIDVPTTPGPFTTTSFVHMPPGRWAHVGITCNLGRATSSQNSILYSAQVTQTP